MGKRRRYPEPGEAAGGQANTYGVAVTLLLCFFVLLYACSDLDLDKFHSMAAGMGIAFAGEAPATSPTSQPEPTTQDQDTTAATVPTQSASAQASRALDGLARQIRLMLVEAGLAGEVEADHENTALAIRLPDSVFFDEGEAELGSEAFEPLNKIVDIIVEYSYIIGKVRVEGHTDSVPPSGSLYGDNWELSGIRAARAAKYMLQTGRIPADSVYYSGFGETRPVADGSTAEGRQANRRIEFVLQELNLQALILPEES